MTNFDRLEDQAFEQWTSELEGIAFKGDMEAEQELYFRNQIKKDD